MYLPQYHIVDIEPTIFCSNANIYIILLDIQQNHTDIFHIYIYSFTKRTLMLRKIFILIK
jgi:hypothetical protein